MADELSTMHRNALGQHFGRRDFTAEEIAGLDYQQVARLPKVGAEGLRAIRLWLRQRGLDLRNVPSGEAVLPLVDRDAVGRAIQLLERRGYRVIPPGRMAED